MPAFFIHVFKRRKGFSNFVFYDLRRKAVKNVTLVTVAYLYAGLNE